MATPTYPSKRYYSAGTRRGSTWGTAVALGANYGVLVTGDSGMKKNQKYEPYAAIDQILPQDGILSMEDSVEITPPVALQYEMGPVGGWIASVFGTSAGVGNLVELGVYKHVFTYANSCTDFFTYAEERPGHVWEVPSAMPFKAIFKPNGASIAASVTMRGNTLKDNSTINNYVTMDNISYVSRSTFLHFTHGKFLFNPQANAALDANNDALTISDFELSFERSIDNVHAIGQTNIILPVEGDIPTSTLKITLPRAGNNDVDLTAFTAGTAYKGKLYFTGATIGNNSTYSVAFYFPRLMYLNTPDVKMEGVIKNEITFSMMEASASVNGMNYTRPYMEVINSHANDYLE